MKGFGCIRQAQLHFEQPQAPFPPGLDAAGDSPGHAHEPAYQQQDGDPADHGLIPFPRVSSEINSKTRTP